MDALPINIDTIIGGTTTVLFSAFLTGTGASVSVPVYNTLVRVTKTTVPFNSINVFLYKAKDSVGSIAVPINAKYYVFDTSS